MWDDHHGEIHPPKKTSVRKLSSPQQLRPEPETVVTRAGEVGEGDAPVGTLLLLWRQRLGRRGGRHSCRHTSPALLGTTAAEDTAAASPALATTSTAARRAVQGRVCHQAFGRAGSWEWRFGDPGDGRNEKSAGSGVGHRSWRPIHLVFYRGKSWKKKCTHQELQAG